MKSEAAVHAVDTPHGPARVHRYDAPRAVGALVLVHGAGGGVAAPDLQVVGSAAVALRLTVVLVEQPYRVAGRRAPAPAAQLDTAWLAVVRALELPGTLIVGGRSSGARVACRTASACGARAVLCLAFPLVPPRAKRPVSRLAELDAAGVPVLVVQGERDQFGCPRAAPGRDVVKVRGDHRLDADLPAVARAVTGWLPQLISGG